MTTVQAIILCLQLLNLFLAASTLYRTYKINELLIEVRKLQDIERRARPYDIQQAQMMTNPAKGGPRKQ